MQTFHQVNFTTEFSLRILELPSLKDEFKNQFKRKKETQKEAHNRRQRIRELQEDRDWN